MLKPPRNLDDLYGPGAEQANAAAMHESALLQTLEDLANAADERFAPDDPYRAIIDQARKLVSEHDR